MQSKVNLLCMLLQAAMTHHVKQIHALVTTTWDHLGCLPWAQLQHKLAASLGQTATAPFWRGSTADAGCTPQLWLARTPPSMPACHCSRSRAGEKREKVKYKKIEKKKRKETRQENKITEKPRQDYAFQHKFAQKPKYIAGLPHQHWPYLVHLHLSCSL